MYLVKSWGPTSAFIVNNIFGNTYISCYLWLSWWSLWWSTCETLFNRSRQNTISSLWSREGVYNACRRSRQFRDCMHFWERNFYRTFTFRNDHPIQLLANCTRDPCSDWYAMITAWEKLLINFQSHTLAFSTEINTVKKAAGGHRKDQKDIKIWSWAMIVINCQSSKIDGDFNDNPPKVKLIREEGRVRALVYRHGDRYHPDIYRWNMRDGWMNGEDGLKNITPLLP